MKEKLKRKTYLLNNLVKTYRWKTPVETLKFLYLKKRYGILYGEFRTIRNMFISKEKKDSFYSWDEYISNCLKINPPSKLSVLRDKRTIIKRLPQYLGRECLIEEFINDIEFISFVRRHSSFYAKKSFSTEGKGIRVFRDIYTEEDRKRAYEICKEEECVIIEEFIPQHSVLSEIYPHVVNTIRLHTLRTAEGIKIVFTPELYIPSGGERNTIHTANMRYKVFIDIDTGRLWDKAFSVDGLEVVRYGEVFHPDTGTSFGDICIPFWQEAKAMVIDAAFYIPELSYIGWDVAISPHGPVIIEGNAISGSMRVYQMENALVNGGYGLRKECEEMFASAVKCSGEGD